MSGSRQPLPWPPTSGEMARRVREHDWAATPLGAIETWSERLRAVVELVLDSPLVSSLVCGPERLLLYNDAAARLYGDRHPAALGRPLPETFPEGWAAAGAALYARVFAGEAVQVAAQPVDLRGEPGRAPDVFDATLTPVRDAAGQVIAAQMIGFEVGARVRAEAALRGSEERQALLLRLSDALRPLGDPTAIQGVAAGILGEQMGASRAYYVELDEARQVATVAQEYRRGEVPSLVGHHAFAAYGATLELLRAGRAAIFDDVEAEPGVRPDDLPAYRALGLRAFLSTPLIKDGELVCAMCAVSAEPRRWTPAEVDLVEEVAERTWAAVERARAESRLRESEERFRSFAENSADTLWIIGAGTGRLEYLSPAFEPMWGEARERIMGSLDRWAELVHTQDRERARAGLPRLRAGEAHTVEYRIVRPSDGAVRWIRDVGFPIRDERGQVRRVAGIARDVTRAKQAEAAAVAELDAMRRLHDLGGRSMNAPSLEALLGDILDAVVNLHGADSGTLRLYDEAARTLRIAASRGVEQFFLDRFAELPAGEGSACGAALARRERIVVEDREQDPAGAENLRGVEEVGFRALQATPLFSATGAPIGLISTHFREPRRLTEREHHLTDLYARQAGDAIAARLNEQELRANEARVAESEGRLRTLLEGIPILVWRSCARGRWTWASPQWLDFTGQSMDEAVGQGWLGAIHPDDRPRALQAWTAAHGHGRLDVEYRVRRAADGAYLWHHTRSVPMADERGRVVEWVGTSTDVQQLKELQERQAVLVAELQHRTRNLIAVVRSIAGQTLAELGPGEGFREAFNGRLAALSRVQGLLSRADDAPITVGALICLELDALGGLDGAHERVTLAGPPVRLRNSVVQTLALALHELATNARKYGALSDGQGSLDVRWRAREGDGQGRLVLEWVERGGPVPDTAGGRRGYGRELIERALPYALGATTHYELDGAGVRCIIDMPLDGVERRGDCGP